jgi:L-asparaginase
MKIKNVLIIYTGGTIGMKPGPKGFAPVPGYLTELMHTMPELHHESMPQFDVYEYPTLLDSADMTPQSWVALAQQIAAYYDNYDGFVVLHGTDTMAYTAAALSFLLRDLGKTVIVTGSQIPITQIRSDAREQLITALQIAGTYLIPEVCIYFNNRLLRGNRAVKVNATGLDAFDSPNFPTLADIGIDITVHWERTLPMPADSDLHAYDLQPVNVGAMRIFPGVTAAVVHNFLRQPLQGFVIETYGVGNAPANAAFLAELAAASERGVVIVNVTQCVRGTVKMATYATGEKLVEAGVVSGVDMTPMAALTKLFFLLSRGFDTQTVRRLMTKNLRGELSSPDEQ